MTVTAIKLIRNHMQHDIGVTNHENPGTTGGGEYVIRAGRQWQCDLWIPWYNDGQTVDHSIEFQFSRGWQPGAPELNTSFYLYQHRGYIYYVQSVPYGTLPNLANPILVSGNADEGGDRSVDVTGSSNADLRLTFY